VLSVTFPAAVQCSESGVSSIDQLLLVSKLTFGTCVGSVDAPLSCVFVCVFRLLSGGLDKLDPSRRVSGYGMRGDGKKESVRIVTNCDDVKQPAAVGCGLALFGRATRSHLGNSTDMLWVPRSNVTWSCISELKRPASLKSNGFPQPSLDGTAVALDIQAALDGFLRREGNEGGHGAFHAPIGLSESWI
jgi:hypothetical protein